MNNLKYLLFILLFALLSCEDNKEDSSVVKDADGYVYETVTIGTQTWMAENLKTSKFRNGDDIPTTSSIDLDISDLIKPICQWVYEGDESNLESYGRLYTWWTVVDDRHICPDGWHIPTMEEWTVLSDYLEGTDVAGGKLKESGFNHWLEPNTGATNETGFTALPGGGRGAQGSYYNMGEESIWYYSPAYGSYSNAALVIIIGNTSQRLSDEDFNPNNGYSVRCIKD